MTRILLTGSTGLVGRELQRVLMNLGKVIAVGREISSLGLSMDLSHVQSIKSFEHQQITKK